MHQQEPRTTTRKHTSTKTQKNTKNNTNTNKQKATRTRSNIGLTTEKQWVKLDSFGSQFISSSKWSDKYRCFSEVPQSVNPCNCSGYTSNSKDTCLGNVATKIIVYQKIPCLNNCSLSWDSDKSTCDCGE